MTTTIDPRTALLELHRTLLQSERVRIERIDGRMTATELLQAAADDLRLSWLRELSERLTALDAAAAEGDAQAAAALRDELRGLLDPPDDTTAFGRLYLAALQDDPAVVLAHRDATAALRD